MLGGNIVINDDESVLPNIGSHQKWCCSHGCGECTPERVLFEHSRTEDANGNLLESLSEMVWASNCCKADLVLWDEEENDFVFWEPILPKPVTD